MDDELRYWQMASSFWKEGVFLFHGRPYDIPSIAYPILLSPLFAIRDLSLVFDLARLVNGFLVSAVLFPTYFLAREFTDSRKALLPAVLAGLVPGAAYSSLIMTENLYYPLFCLSFWLAWRTLMRADWRGAALTALAFFGTFFAKPNLILLAGAYVVALTYSIGRHFRDRSDDPRARFELLPRLVPLAGLPLAAIVRLGLRGGLGHGNWKGLLGGEAYASVLDPSIGPTPIRIAALAAALLISFSLSIGFAPIGTFIGAAARFGTLTARLRPYVIFGVALGLVHLAAVIRLSMLDSEPRMQERYLFILAPLLLVLLFAVEYPPTRTPFVTTVALWLMFAVGLARYRRMLSWSLQSDSPSLTGFFLISRRFPGVAPLILASVVAGALALVSVRSQRTGVAFSALALLFVLMNAGWYANVYGVDRDLRSLRRFALDVGTRAPAGETVAVITDGLDRRVVWALEFWSKNPVALLTVSEQKNEWWIDATGTYAEILRVSKPNLLVTAASGEDQVPREFRLLAREPGLPTPALLYGR